jgi:uncharacterized protein
MRFNRILLLIAMLFLIYPDHAAARQNKQEPSAAVAALIKASEQGDAKSQFVLGSYYYFGIRIFQDYTEAVKWYRKAADQREASAQYSLGAVYADGTGVAQDYVLAHMWWSLSAAGPEGQV